MNTPTPSPAASVHPQDIVLDLLAQHDLPYESVEHPPVFTIEQALAATPALGGIKTKNVFLRDAKGTHHFLVIVPHDRRLDLSRLGDSLFSTKLSMGSPERLFRHLGVAPGAVSLLSLINDRARAVELVVDEEVWASEKIQAHPLINTMTLALGQDAVKAFLALTGHSPRVIAVP